MTKDRTIEKTQGLSIRKGWDENLLNGGRQAQHPDAMSVMEYAKAAKRSRCVASNDLERMSREKLVEKLMDWRKDSLNRWQKITVYLPNGKHERKHAS